MADPTPGPGVCRQGHSFDVGDPVGVVCPDCGRAWTVRTEIEDSAERVERIVRAMYAAGAGGAGAPATDTEIRAIAARLLASLEVPR